MRQLRTTFMLLLAALLVSPALGAQEPTPTPAAAPSASAASPVPAPAPRPYEDIIKLWKANLSEDFVKRQIESGTVVYDLTAEEMIRCRDAGIPEALIQAMIATKSKKAGEASAAAPATTPPSVVAPAAVAPAPTAPPAVAPPAVAVPPPPPAPAADADRSWEAMTRRNAGIVLFKGRWDVGTLHFKEELLRWVDAKDAGKNLLVPARQMKEQFLTCLKKAGGNECFEWGFKTKDGEYRFRDVAWEQGENRKPQEIFDFFKAIYPSLVSSMVPVDSK